MIFDNSRTVRSSITVPAVEDIVLRMSGEECHLTQGNSIMLAYMQLQHPAGKGEGWLQLCVARADVAAGLFLLMSPVRARALAAHLLETADIVERGGVRTQ